ncbi:MAG TPA: carboxypeptidase regulatory-like domain-containing protein [Kofleriaceae bacterium]|nr:carboxypeptidase regulatory-like domain-containing protein [Kofleriaceae bacterium]
MLAVVVAAALVGVVLAQPAPPQPAPPPPRPVGSVTGKVVVYRDGKKLETFNYSDVVVYIKDARDAPGAPRPKPQIRQKNQTYSPRLTVVPVGTTIRFPNDDRVDHNVFSPLTGKDYFDLGRYRAGAGRSRTFDVAGEIDIYCDIHWQMAAKVKIVPSSLYAGPGGRTAVAADGTYRIDNVPPGRQQVVAWLPDSPEVQTRITVTADRSAAAKDLNLHQGTPAARHKRLDGTSYPHPDYP